MSSEYPGLTNKLTKFTAKQEQGTRDIKKFFGVTLPNILYNDDAKMDLPKLTASVDTRANKLTPVLKNEWKKGIHNLESPVNKKNTKCEAVGNGDQFDHLSSLAVLKIHNLD